MQKIFIFFFLALLGTGWMSCHKMLDIPSKRAVAAPNMWQTKNDAWAGSSACYGLARAALANENAHWAYGELRGHDFAVTSRGDLNAVVDNKLTANYATMDEWRDWRRFYAAIDQCNLAIQKLPLVPERDYRYSTSEMKLDLAQVRAVRAFLYYYMVRIWGDVPLVTTPSDGSFGNVQREDWHKVLELAAEDARAAFDDLPWRYNGKSPEAPGNYRGQAESHWAGIAASKGMVLTLLAHIYDWEENYTEALKYCDQLMDNQSNTNYQLVTTDQLTKLNGTFKGRLDIPGGNIFQLDFNMTHTEYSTTGQLEDWTLHEPDIPKKESELYVEKDTILGIFDEKSDQRKDKYFINMDDEHPEFYKLKQVDALVQNPPLRFYTSAIVIFRYEEMYLLRAECRTRLGMTLDAVEDLNTVRAKRGLLPMNGTPSQDELLDAILQERRRELMGEGWRWYDLVHFKKVPQYTNLTEEAVTNGAIYWPVSKAALEQNPMLTQNSFWK
ncbi:RagB/SusD family nutrient uptake outer membrane protein [Compostibacter hankyongensis]|uniref:RagB/SusD family nutrient uptake outer membrane protein n=1 Tax=Compostibacter hankyongensis TaxID=1007089 RepID=A0ABP8FT46_9BACT